MPKVKVDRELLLRVASNARLNLSEAELGIRISCRGTGLLDRGLGRTGTTGSPQTNCQKGKRKEKKFRFS